MRTSSLSYPRQGRTGVATATSGMNEFQPPVIEKSNGTGTAAFFTDPLVNKLTSPSFTGKNEILCRSFSPFGGTWDYSEVD